LKSLLSSPDAPDSAYLDSAHLTNRPTSVFTPEIASAFMNQTAGLGLMIIDSFRGAFRLTGDGENLAGVAGERLRELQDLAVSNLWLILITHHKKKKKTKAVRTVSQGPGTG